MSSTDTNQASELFELCKKVYERTKWDNYCEYWSFGGEYTVHKDSMTSIEVQTAIIPLYTSDYLLEKLLPITSIQLKRKANGGIRLFYFPEKPDYAIYDYDTPLKCLLALTIALSEAGELNNDQSS
jgi:hypothetical protein